MLLNFAQFLNRPTLEMASGDFDFRQSTMAAAPAARTALCGQFGFFGNWFTGLSGCWSILSANVLSPYRSGSLYRPNWSRENVKENP